MLKMLVLDFNNSALQSEDPIIHSDTLFAALLKNEEIFYGRDSAEELKKKFDCGDIEISSAFPYMGESIYVPMDLTFLMSFVSGDKEKEEMERNRKKYKNAYVSIKEIRDIVEDKKLPTEYGPEINKTILSKVVKVDIDKNIQTVSEFRDIKLGVLLKGSELEDRMKMLGETGILADKTTGYGAFRTEKIDVGISKLESLTVNLSLYIPTKDSWDNIRKCEREEIYWNIIKRTGRRMDCKQYLKKPQTYIREGAVLPKINDEKNRVIDFPEGYSYYRGGVFI